MAKPKEPEMEIPVAFGNLNVGDKTARLGITISRGNMTPSKADKTLCGRRLSGKIVAVPDGVSAENDPLPGMNGDIEVSGIFDVKGFGVTGKHITAGLTFAIKGMDVAELAHFAKREGRVVVDKIEEIDDEEEEEETEEE